MAAPTSVTERLLDKKATFQSLKLGLDRRITKGLALKGFIYPTLVQVRHARRCWHGCSTQPAQPVAPAATAARVRGYSCGLAGTACSAALPTAVLAPRRAAGSLCGRSWAHTTPCLPSHATTVSSAQAEAVPLALRGKDLLVRAKTGSGKTIAYALPMLNTVLETNTGGIREWHARTHTHMSTTHACARRVTVLPTLPRPRTGKPGVKAIVLVPTRELCAQTQEAITELCHYCRDVVTVLALSHTGMADQAAQLLDQPDVLISTPGRLVAHLKAGASRHTRVGQSCPAAAAVAHAWLPARLVVPALTLLPAARPLLGPWFQATSR